MTTDNKWKHMSVQCKNSGQINGRAKKYPMMNTLLTLRVVMKVGVALIVVNGHEIFIIDKKE